MIKDMQNLAIS